MKPTDAAVWPSIRVPAQPDMGGPVLAVYRGLGRAIDPLLGIWLARRARMGKEDPARLNERRAIEASARPDGHLAWVHAASVGEALAVLVLIRRIADWPGWSVLLTTQTRTSADLIAGRLPPGAVHRFAPLDTPAVAARFFGHWRPDLAVFVESEIWPNLILEARARGAKSALVSARMSARSFKGWQRAGRAARALFGTFDAILAQDSESAQRLARLGGRAEITGNLKWDAEPLPDDAPARAGLADALGERPVLLAASTHPGEETLVFEAFARLRTQTPDALLILVPRHPERGAAITREAEGRGLKAVLRSTGARPAPDTDIYVADTLGELGLFYRLAPFAFVGGSLMPKGGQNPLEPARLKRPVLMGPHTGNFMEIIRILRDHGALRTVRTAGDLAEATAALLSDPPAARAMGENAGRAAAALSGALARTEQALRMLTGAHDAGA